MVEPFEVQDQLMHMVYKPDRVLKIFFSTKKYDQVIKKNKSGKFSQLLEDFTTCDKSISDLANCYNMYSMTGSEDFTFNQPTSKEFVEGIELIRKMIESQPNK